jgi:hypothetical protein
MGKKMTELIIEAENDDKVLDTAVYKPYTLLQDTDLDRLNKAINILAVKKEYRVVSVSESFGQIWTACMEKKVESGSSSG